MRNPRTLGSQKILAPAEHLPTSPNVLGQPFYTKRSRWGRGITTRGRGLSLVARLLCNHLAVAFTHSSLKSAELHTERVNYTVCKSYPYKNFKSTKTNNKNK